MQVEFNQTDGRVEVTEELLLTAERINDYESAYHAFRQELIEQGRDPSGIVDLDQGSWLFDDNGDYVGWGNDSAEAPTPAGPRTRHPSGKTFSDVLKRLAEDAPLSASPLYGDALGSGSILMAEDAVANGEAIPARAYSPFPDFERRLRISDDELFSEQSFDGILTLLLARGLGTRRDFSLIVYQEGQDSRWFGGPWLGVNTTESTVEVTLMSNHQLLEHKEGWFSAALSLFGWTTLPTGGVAKNVYRQVWDAPVDPVDLAAACSLVVIHVFHCLRVPRLALLTTLAHDPLFRFLPRQWTIHDDVKDLTLSRKYSAETRAQGMIPTPTWIDPRDYTRITLENIEKAQERAASVDDMTGIETLTDLRTRLTRRATYEPQMCHDVRLALHRLIGEHPASDAVGEGYYD